MAIHSKADKALGSSASAASGKKRTCRENRHAPVQDTSPDVAQDAKSAADRVETGAVHYMEFGGKFHQVPHPEA